MNFIPASDIINEIKNKLSVYFENGYLDESLLYRKIRYCVSSIGLKILPKKSKIVKIENFKGGLPSDFYKLETAIGCLSYYIKWKDTTVAKTYEKDICELELCKTECDYCHDDCGRRYQVIQKFPEYTIEWNEFFDVCISNTSRPFCTDSCFSNNLASYNEITIENKVINTNFEKGWVYVEYLATIDTDEDIMIPDYPKIIDWIIDELRVECFEYLYDNGLQDVSQRLGNAKQDLTISKLDARAFFKMNEVKDFYNLGNILVSRYNQQKL